MVKLNINLILSGVSGNTKKMRDESISHFLSRLTHLHLQERQLDEIKCDLSMCPNLLVLYLYDNKLLRIPTLDGNKFLTRLYLQDNSIGTITNLSSLRNLKVLYLGGNCLNIIEGLENLWELEELYVENQNLPPGEKLLFGSSSIMAIAPSLRILKTSGNQLDSLKELQPLHGLTHLYINNNKLFSMKDLSDVLINMYQLVQLEVYSNPFCLLNKFRDKIIILVKSLEMLDGREISKTTKKFLHNWSVSKNALKRNECKAINSHFPMNHLAKGDAADNGRKAFPRFATIAGYVIPSLPIRKEFSRILAKASTVKNDATNKVSSSFNQTLH